ncbi:hypothetical protein Ciccas_008861 [Cichlidogyrus casuarinus]|uniref:FYVE-type domain-containing protein n=1 Tax=Cichlidogyrus casuarinus TaxID=1844966 RepID=A0ABD2Q314_9PLAT
METAEMNCKLTYFSVSNGLLILLLDFVWRDLYLRWEWRLPGTVPLSNQFVSNLDRASVTLVEHNKLLRARISQLCRLLEKSEREEIELLKGESKLQSGTESSFSTPSVVSLGDGQKLSPSTDAVLLANERVEASVKMGDYEEVRLLDYINSRRSMIDPDLVDVDELMQPLDSALTVITNPETIFSQTREDRAELDLVCPFTASIKQLKSELSSVATQWETGLSMGALCPCCGILMASLPRQAHCITCGKITCERCLGELPHKRPVPGVWNHSTENESAKTRRFTLSCDQALIPGRQIFQLCLTCRNALINSKVHHFTGKSRHEHH